MAMTSSSGSGAVATGREVSISVLDATGTPVADANVRLYVDGTFYGQALTRSGSLRPITLSIEDATASVRVVVDVPGHLPREAVLDPGRNDAHFVYPRARSGLATVAPGLQPLAVCPDGTSNWPCIICRSGDRQWRICV